MEGSSFPEGPKRWVVQRYKLVWRVFCISNLALGAYIFSRTPKKEKTVAASKVETKAPAEPVVENTYTPPPKDTVSSPPIPKPVTEHEPVTEREHVIQREPVTEHEPVIQREPVIEREPMIQHEPVMQREPVIKREPVMERETIPTHQQQELYKWMLEEKMKTKPNNREEEERINEDKALLENYIRALSFSAQFVPKKDKTVVASKVETKASEDTVHSPPSLEPVKEHKLIPAYQQQELFKWMLDEKRKIKPKNREEEEQIGEEKSPFGTLYSFKFDPKYLISDLCFRQID